MSRESGSSEDEGTRPVIPPEMQACPECRGEMVEGWVPDEKGQPVLLSVPKWQPGRPRVREINLIVGKLPMDYPKPEDPQNAIPICAYRCVRCGYLKFYARGER